MAKKKLIKKCGIYAVPKNRHPLRWLEFDVENAPFFSSKRSAKWSYDDEAELDFFEVTITLKKV